LGASIPVLAIKTERKQVPVDVECDTWRGTDGDGRNEKSDESEKRSEHGAKRVVMVQLQKIN
jgi:hypothetical protein